MPVKNVYGKRTQVKASTFAPMLTPEKERDLGMNPKKGKKAATKQKVEKQNQNEARAPLEEQLAGLSLGEAPKKQSRKKSKAATLAVVLIPAKEKDVRRSQLSGEDGGDDNKAAEEKSGKLVLKDASEKRTRQKVEKVEKVVETTNTDTKEAKTEDAQTHKPDPKDVLSIIVPAVDATTMPKRGRPKKRVPPSPVPIIDCEAAPICLDGLPKSSPEIDVYDNYAQPLFAFNSRSQFKAFAFEDFSAELEDGMTVEKIAEASFSEVYRLTLLPNSVALDGPATESVLKLIPIRTPPNAPLPCKIEGAYRPRKKADQARQEKRERLVREEDDTWKTPVEDILGELKLLQNLSEIPGFTQFRDLTIVQGRPCGMFGRAWKKWNDARTDDEISSFPDPNKKASYEDKQLWAVIEMADAGTDCEKLMAQGGLSTIWEVWDVFWGVVISITKAEQDCQFEHRDLHLGNICIRSKTPQLDLLHRTIANPRKNKLGFSGLQTTVIDYTLSRADIPEAVRRRTSLSSSSSHSSYSRSSSSSSVDGDALPRKTAYLDLNKDLTLFQGDASEEYQYEIYRYMRGLVFHDSAFSYDPMDNETSDRTMASLGRPHRLGCSPPKDIWAGFYPKTNLIWCHFILSKLLNHLHEMGGDPEFMPLKTVMRNVEGVSEDKAKSLKKRAIVLHLVLREKVAKWLDPEELSSENAVRSVAGLVDWAVGHKWLDEGDYTGEVGEGSF